MVEDFDAFVEKHNIQPDEMGAAFAAWLGGAGWNGDFEKVEEPQVIDCRHCAKPVIQAYDPLEGYYWTHELSDTTDCLNGSTRAEPDNRLGA